MKAIENYKAPKAKYSLFTQVSVFGVAVGVVSGIFLYISLGLALCLACCLAGYKMQDSQNKKDKQQSIDKFKSHLTDFRTIELVKHTESTLADHTTKEIIVSFLREFRNFEPPKKIEKIRFDD